MTSLLDVIALDDPGAHIDRGRRSLTWTAATPGELHRNAFSMAWFSVTEQEPLRGEPLWLSAHRRRPTDEIARTRFTDAAFDKLKAEIVPVLARDFGERWERASRARADGAGWRRSADEMRRRADWFDRGAELVELWAEGLIELRAPVQGPEWRSSQPPTVRVLTSYSHGVEFTERVADAYLDGEHVGYQTARGLVPLEVPS